MRVLIEPETAEGGQLVVQSGQVCRVGRRDPAELICSGDSFLSGLHFAVDCSGPECRVRDLASSNGTYRNGSRITEAVVADGDLISAGQTHFRVRLERESSSPSPLPVLDESELKATKSSVLQALRRAPGPLFALLDAARDDHILDLLLRSGEKYQSLYEGSQGRELDNWAPYLVALPADSRLLLYLLHQGWGQSWGIYLVCSEPFAELRRHFRKFLLVQAEDQQRLYFRFYDPRVLRSFLPACTPAEGASFYGPVQQYLLEGERSELLQFFPDAEALYHTPAPAGIISNDQFRAVEHGLFFSRLYKFLLDRVKPLKLRQALDDRQSVLELWEQAIAVIPTSSEYRLAIFLTYTLCRKSAGFNPAAAVREWLEDPDPVFRAKSYFEDSGVCRFSEFDL